MRLGAVEQSLPFASSAAEWLTAVGTLLAVVVAVGLQGWLDFRAKRRRPLLTLRFDEHKYQEENNPETGAGIPYLRLAVTNARGKETARDVEILLLRVDEVGGGGVKRWLVNPAFAWANSLDPMPRMTIPPGVTRYVDIGCWVRSSGLILKLCVKPEPGSGRHHLPPGRYRLLLSVTARNADATTWSAELSFDEPIPKNLSASVTKNHSHTAWRERD